MNDKKPVFVQIMDIIESDILAGVYHADDLIISTTQISKIYPVNPATAVKAVGKLADEGVLYKKRGVGMCVSSDAFDIIIDRRKNEFFGTKLVELLQEAERLNIDKETLIDIIRKYQGENQ
jgi:DNA-binding transcriptional regulator YhcF (GntR family)